VCGAVFVQITLLLREPTWVVGRHVLAELGLGVKFFTAQFTHKIVVFGAVLPYRYRRNRSWRAREGV